MSKIFYIMGKSSSGKDTIYKRLSETMPELCTVIPYTTRPIREGEQDGVEYYFVGEDRLREMQEAAYGHILPRTTDRSTWRSTTIL